MKKLTVLVLVLMMALSVAAMAEQPTIETVNWEDLTAVEDMAALAANGEFQELTDIGLKIWIPNGLTQVETEGTAYLFTDEEGTSGVSVFVDDAPEGLDPMDPEALYAYINASGAMDVTPSAVNGIFAVAYKLGDETHPQFCITYGADNGKVITFVIDVADQTNQIEMAAMYLILASISAI